MKQILWLDFETRSTLDLKKTSAHRYSEEAKPILLGCAFDDEPVRVIDFLSGEELPERVVNAMTGSDVWLAAFNIGFERAIIAHSPIFEFANNEPERWFDVQTMAYEAGIVPLKPLKALSLEALSKGLPGIKAFKSDPNGKLKDLFCKPNKRGDFASPEQYKEQWKEFIEYCKTDVEVMRELFKHPLLQSAEYPFHPREKAVADVDQRINDRGIPINGDFCLAAAIAAQNASKLQNQIFNGMTLGRIDKLTQSVKLREWINEIFNLGLDSVGAETIGNVLAETDNPFLKEVCEVILDSGSSSSKFSAALQAASTDLRVHGALFMCGAARTRRWGGRLIQPQNMRRPKGSDKEIEETRTAILNGKVDGILLPSILDTVRSMIEAPPGKLLLSVDYSSIENRALMWLADDTEMLDFFRRVDDGSADCDPYEFTYATAFGIDRTKVNKKQRFIGKMMMLMFQYLGGVGGLVSGLRKSQINVKAFADDLEGMLGEDEIVKGISEFQFVESRGGETFGLSAEQYGRCAALKNRWRAAHPKVVQLGNDCILAMAECVGAKVGTKIKIADGKVTLIKKERHIGLSLFGGEIQYPDVEVSWPGNKPDISVSGLTQVAGKRFMMAPVFFYAGKALENMASSLSRNIMAIALVKLEKAGFNPVFHVHDEVVMEIPDDGKAEQWLKKASEIMTIQYPGLEGFPLAASGWYGRYYRKD